MRRNRRAPCIVDTNVAVVANGKSDAGPACTAECATSLNEVIRSGHVVIDDASPSLVLAEYRAHLNSSGQPGVGDQFYRWLILNQYNSERCSRVKITATEDGSYTEFPRHDELAQFDPSDRKFVALAAAHPSSPCILQAFDSKWWGFRGTLKECGMNVRFVCPNEISEKHRKKFAR
jgi:hypothetical protein